jgi:hypothetical protein
MFSKKPQFETDSLSKMGKALGWTRIDNVMGTHAVKGYHPESGYDFDDVASHLGQGHVAVLRGSKKDK